MMTLAWCVGFEFAFEFVRDRGIFSSAVGLLVLVLALMVTETKPGPEPGTGVG